MKSKKEPVTAAELMARLEADPDFVARRDAFDEELDARATAWTKAESPLREALAAVGLQVESAWDLVNTSEPYPEALPVLVEHLGKPYPSRVREGIARALAVPDAKFAWRILVEAYTREETSEVKEAIAAAVAATADETVFTEVVALIRAKENGASRVLLLEVLEHHSPAERARTVLQEVAADAELTCEAQAMLKRMRERPPT